MTFKNKKIISGEDYLYTFPRFNNYINFHIQIDGKAELSENLFDS